MRGRAVAFVVIGLATVLVLAGMFAELISPSSSGRGETGGYSVSNTTASGTSTFAELLRRTGHAVTTREAAFDDGPMPESGTLVMFAPRGVSRVERDTLETWLEGGRGRRLLLVRPTNVGEVTEALPGLKLKSDTDEFSEEPRALPTAPAPETDGVASITARASDNAVFTPSNALTLFALDGDIDRPAIVTRPALGRSTGTIVAVADAVPLTNSAIASGDNAAAALRLVGAPGVAVQFDQFHLSSGSAGAGTPLAMLPPPIQVLLLGLLVAGFVGAISAGIRFGPPLPEPEVPPRRRVEFVDALGTTFANAGASGPAEAMLRDDLRGRLRRRVPHVDPDDTAAFIAAASAATGIDANTMSWLVRDDLSQNLDLLTYAKHATAARLVLDGQVDKARTAAAATPAPQGIAAASGSASDGAATKSSVPAATSGAHPSPQKEDHGTP